MVATGTSGGIIGSVETDITNPYQTIPCHCVYCFVCIATRLENEEGDGWTCLRCGVLVKACRPWDGDVSEESITSSTQKIRNESNKEVPERGNDQYLNSEADSEANEVKGPKPDHIISNEDLDSKAWTR